MKVGSFAEVQGNGFPWPGASSERVGPSLTLPNRNDGAERSASMHRAELKLGDRVWGEVEKNSLLSCQAKETQQAPAPKTMCPYMDLVRSFIVIVQEWGC